MVVALNWPSSYVLRRTALVTLIAAAISISVSTGIRIIFGVEADWVTIGVRLVLPFIIAIPLALVWFTRMERVDRDYRALVKQVNELRHRASTDPMTELLNRRSFVEKFEVAISQCQGGMFVVADVDYLKALNDEHGHLVGDDAIMATAAALSEVLGDDSLIARIGGDEFCALVPRRSAGNADQLRGEINRVATREFRKRSGLIDGSLSISVGVMPCGKSATFREMLERTDSNLYRKKRSRRSLQG